MGKVAIGHIGKAFYHNTLPKKTMPVTISFCFYFLGDKNNETQNIRDVPKKGKENKHTKQTTILTIFVFFAFYLQWLIIHGCKRGERAK